MQFQGLIQWGAETPFSGGGPPAGAKCPRFWAKCPKVPRFRSGMAPNAPFRGQIFTNFWGRTPRPP